MKYWGSRTSSVKWEGKWEFRNVMHHRHGSRGELTVMARTAEEARGKMKLEASTKLFGTTMMQTYINISGLKEAKR